MNRIKTVIAIAIVALFASCAKENKVSSGESTRNYFYAWMKVHYPDAEPLGMGAYYVPEYEKEGPGQPAGDSTYVFVTYTSRLIDGTVNSTNDTLINQQLGTYKATDWNGPQVWENCTGFIPEGVILGIKDMKEGGRRRIVVPSWLSGSTSYSSEEEYIKNIPKSGEHIIYDIELKRVEKNITDYELQILKEFSDKYLGEIDTLSKGFYYKQLVEPSDTTSFPIDTTIYINYTGRLLNGQIFDTTIKDSAKVWGIYSSSKTYEPASVSWAENHTDYKLTTSGSSEGSSVIEGFSLTLKQMRAHEKGVGVFYSPLGYQSSGSGTQIPGYAPLIFEIEIVDEPED